MSLWLKARTLTRSVFPLLVWMYSTFFNFKWRYTAKTADSRKIISKLATLVVCHFPPLNIWNVTIMVCFDFKTFEVHSSVKCVDILSYFKGEIPHHRGVSVSWTIPISATLEERKWWFLFWHLFPSWNHFVTNNTWIFFGKESGIRVVWF